MSDDRAVRIPAVRRIRVDARTSSYVSGFCSWKAHLSEQLGT